MIISLVRKLNGKGITLRGPVVGAGVLVPIGEMLRIYFNQLPGLHFIIYGLIVVVILLSLRSGLIPFLGERQRERLKVRKEAKQ